MVVSGASLGARERPAALHSAQHEHGALGGPWLFGGSNPSDWDSLSSVLPRPAVVDTGTLSSQRF